jgi:uncharacterized protein (TIGR02598 family)
MNPPAHPKQHRARGNGALGAGRSGFSLIEIVLALGIITYVLVAILMLFPLALNTAADSKNETRATFIAQNLLAELQALPGDLNPKRHIFITTGGDPVACDLSASAAPCYLAFNENGETLRELTAGDFQQASGLPPGTTFLGSVNIEPVTASGDYRNSRVTLTVEWPPIPATSPQRQRQHFIAFLMYRQL